MTLLPWFTAGAHSARSAHRRQLKQDATAVTIVSDLISGDTQGAGQAIADASASNDVQGIATALTTATVSVGAHAV